MSVTCIGRLARAIDRLGMSRPELAVVVHAGVGDGLVGEGSEGLHRVGDGRRARCHVAEQAGQGSFVHERAHRILRRLHRKPQVDGRFRRPRGNRLTFSDRTLTLLVLIALGVGVLALVFAALGAAGRRRTREPGGPIRLDDALRGVLDGQARKIDRLEQAVRTLNNTDKRQQRLIDGSVRHVALIRYDAFEDVGGRLSFSCAMLDEHGTGVVLTSINGRQETRVYAKPIAEGRSSHNLSSEEEEAIRQALAAPAEAVQAR